MGSPPPPPAISEPVVYENTGGAAYVTLFLAQYIDELQGVRYVNCGHLPALLLRHDGTLERLDSTSTVLGLFEQWDCSIAERQLSPGDILALYSDAATELFNDRQEEFGQSRLAEALRRNGELPSRAILQSVVGEIQEFSRYEQHDDITLVMAKCKIA